MALSRHQSIPSHAYNCEHPSILIPACLHSCEEASGKESGFPQSLRITATQGEHGTRHALGFTQHIPSPAPSPLAEEGHKSNTVCPYKLCFACVRGVGTAVRTARRVPGSRCVSWL